MNLFLPILSGILLNLIFPKFNLYYLAWIALVPLFISILTAKSHAQAGVLGLICGLFYFGGNLSGVTKVSAWAGGAAYLAWAALGLYAVYILIFACVFKYFSKTAPRISFVSAAALWVILEWLRSFGSYGITILDLSYSQIEVLPLIQTVKYSGGYGISFLIVAVNAAGAQLICFKNKKRQLVYLMLTLLTIALISAGGSHNLKTPLNPPDLKVTLIQPNIDQTTKLDPAKTKYILNRQLNLTRQAQKYNPDIIIWPESAVPVYLTSNPGMLLDLQKVLKEKSAYLLAGLPYFNQKIYNSIFAFSPQGKIIGRYDKEHLVPFGEYLPARRFFYPLLKHTGLLAEEFTPNPEPKLLELDRLKIGAGICFESIFPNLIRKRVRLGAQILVICTNDAWFKNSSLAYRHLNSTRMRAVETSRYVIQAANTGISGIIDPKGRIIKQSRLGEETLLSGKVASQNELTFYSRHGNLLVGICFSYLASLIFFRYRSARITAAQSS